MPAVIDINGTPGSDESAVDLDGAAVLNFTNSAAAGPTLNLWEFLEWPVGTRYNQTWLAAFGPTLATITFTPDMEGTWVVKYTDTNDSTTDTIICGIKSRRTSLRIPGAGETTESDNTIFPAGGAITNHRGWALTRDLGLKYLDDLVTSGSVQIFYLEDAGIVSAISAGTPLALVPGAPAVLFPGTAPAPYNVPIHVPKVQVAQADLASGRYAYVGVLKAGRDTATPVVSNTSYGYITTSIPSGTFVWVSTSGVVQGEAPVVGPVPPAAPATLNFVPASWNVGDFVYLSGTTAGDFVRYSDTFASGVASELMTPIGIVGIEAAPGSGSMVVLPSRYGGSAVDAAKTNMFRGIGDYSSLRVGRTDGASVAGEEDGTVELCAIAGELITAGDIVCISTNGGGVMQAFIADSSTDPDVADNKKYGIFGVAVQGAAAAALGHFTIFGEANATTTAPVSGEILYVGSSTAGLGDTSGTATILSRIDNTQFLVGPYLNDAAIPIPLGIYDGTKLILGTVKDDGLIATVHSPSRGNSVGASAPVNSTDNTTQLGINRSNVYRSPMLPLPSSWTNVDLPNTEADSLMMTTSVYEDTIKGSDLYDVRNQTIGGKVWLTPPAPQPAQDIVGGTLTNGVWDGGGGAAATNFLYGTFTLQDDRLYEELTPIEFEIHGYTDSHTAEADIQIQLEARINYDSNVTLGPIKFTDEATVTTGSVADTNIAFSVGYFSVASGNAFYVPKKDASGNYFHSIDIILERTDTVDASLMIEKVTLQSLYLNKGINLSNGAPPVVYEKKIPAYDLIDTASGGFNIIDDGPGPGAGYITEPTVGACMTAVSAPGPVARTVSTLVGFIPYDSRIDQTSALTVRVLGKYIGTNAFATDLDIDFTYEEITSGNNYDPDITVAGTTLNDTFAPTGAAGVTYEMVPLTFTIPTPNANASGIRFLIKRNIAVPVVGEVSFQISNVFVQSQPVESFGEIEDVYEDGITTANVIDIDDALNVNITTDFSGFTFPSAVGASAESLFVPLKFDKRYDYRKNVVIEVFGYVTGASATPVTLELATSNFYDFTDLSPQTGAAYYTLQNDEADISGATTVYVTKHTFALSAKDVWDFDVADLVPNYSQFRDSGNSGTMLRFKRNDNNGQQYTVLGVRSYATSGKKSGVENLYVNVSEDIEDTTNGYLEVPSAYRADKYLYASREMRSRTMLASAHRYYFNYALDDVTIANGASTTVQPAGVSYAHATYGLLIPYNMAIVGVYAFGIVTPGGPVPSDVTLSFSVMDSTGASQDANDGVLHMPMETISITGGWRWAANTLNFNIPSGTADLHDIPLVYLPSAYSSTGWDVNTGTVTIATIATGAGGTITATIDGVVVTHPTGVGDTPTVSAAAMSVAINTTPALAGVVTASPALGVVTITAVQPGVITLAAAFTDATQTCVAGSGTLEPTPVAFAGNTWFMQCEATNNAGLSIDLSANVTVEAVLLPNFKVSD